MRSGILSDLARAGGLAVVYFGTAKLALALAIPPGNATPVWPPSGIALAAVLLFGHRLWPGIWLGATLVNATTNVTLVTAASIGVGNTLEALVEAYLLRRFVGSRDPFHRGRDVFVFGVLAGGLSCAIAATVGVTSLWLAGLMPWEAYAPNWWTWWLGDLGGLIVVTPLVLTWWHEPGVRWTRSQLGEGLVLLALVLAISLATFGGGLNVHASHFLPYLVMLFLGWTAFRFGPRETATAITAAVGIAIWGTIRGVGPFQGETLNESLLLLQAFVVLVGATGLTLAALVQERRTMEESLRKARDDLEERVQERTAELGRANEALREEVAERQRAEEALRRSARRLGILREIDHAVLAAQSPEAIAQAALDHIRELMRCVHIGVVTFDPDVREATVLAVRASGETNLGPGAHVPLELYGDMEELRQGRCRLVVDLRTHPDDSPGVRAMRSDGVRAFAGIPLVTQGVLIGCLNLGWDDIRELGREDMEVAREVANSLAVALQHARLFQSIREHREQLRALAARLAEAEEEERRRITRELHDRVGQNLTALGINLNRLRGHLPTESADPAGARLEDCLWLVEETMLCIRSVMADLRPPVLDDYGLLAALRWYGEQFSGHTGVPVTLHGEEPTPRLLPAVEVGLFRIAQEALTNVAKHARAGHVTVALTNGGEGRVQLAIADDGIGFDPEAIQWPNGQPGWGLITMKQRAEAVGGRLQVQSGPGKGTQVLIEVER
ncbi:MAG TPA: MASE1 domain-containing protein [Candidatus Methylomirabilis sp.]|nr:MASE1 domain-containing protein [Candidatus Methylomirabilis sp.]